LTGIRSDLPGQITAQVTEAVFDSPTGRVKLVPQGARLIGVYDSQVAFGQSRLLFILSASRGDKIRRLFGVTSK
jgi:type IV secretory pathway VirB10-like protein